MKKIIVFGLTENIGGIETFYMSYYRNLNLKKYQIDFIVVGDTIAFQNEIIARGSKIYQFPNFKRHPMKYIKKLKKLLKYNKYDIVHVNMLSAANILPLKIASKLNVPKVIAHSHNNGIPKGFIRSIMHNVNKSKLNKYANVFLACSDSAGKWMFGENSDFIVLNNAIEIKKFEYEEHYREELRKKYKISSGAFIIGHIGRFCEQKNQDFLLDIYIDYLKINSKSKLFLIGDGKDKEKYKNILKEKEITDSVILLDNKEDVYRYYSAFDLFVLPSKFEGLGIVAVEAQANGLPCLLSDILPPIVKINNNVTFLSISDKDTWVKNIDCIYKKGFKRDDSKKIYKSNFNISKQVAYLEKIYGGD